MIRLVVCLCAARNGQSEHSSFGCEKKNLSGNNKFFFCSLGLTRSHSMLTLHLVNAIASESVRLLNALRRTEHEVCMPSFADSQTHSGTCCTWRYSVQHHLM